MAWVLRTGRCARRKIGLARAVARALLATRIDPTLARPIVLERLTGETRGRDCTN